MMTLFFFSNCIAPKTKRSVIEILALIIFRFHCRKIKCSFGAGETKLLFLYNNNDVDLLIILSLYYFYGLKVYHQNAQNLIF